MRKWGILVAFFLFACLLEAAPENFIKESGIMKTEEIRNLFAFVLAEKEVAFQFLGYSGVIIRTTEGAVVIDPADRLRGEDFKTLPSAAVNLVLFTHDHYDHFNRASTVALYKATAAPILAEPSVVNHLRNDIPAQKLFAASIDQPFQSGNIKVQAVRGTHVGPILLYHITIGKISIFHGGDSGYVPLSGLKADVAFLPTGEPSPTASPEQAFRLALELKPKVIIAIHGSGRQSKELERLIQEKMPDVKMIIPAPNTVNRIKLD